MCDFIQVVPGELSIVTGVPNSGKSEWIDALICNLAMRHGWSFALCSMEKKVCSCSVSAFGVLSCMHRICFSGAYTCVQ